MMTMNEELKGVKGVAQTAKQSSGAVLRNPTSQQHLTTMKTLLHTNTYHNPH
eukprot:m.33575 g.33575  ORF g.33575 m.33575 type:complete len:52 (-) comp9637_c0_seq1:34-189(-)